jgi:nucleotide-binding universal stress UspA family protein
MNLEQPAVSDRIVVGVDGSEPSKHALRWAQFLAHTTGADLDVVNAWLPVVAYGWAGYEISGGPGDWNWNPAENAEKVMVETVDEIFGAHRPAALQTTVREGHAAKVLLEASRGARMLIVGSRGHGGFTGLLLGSVSANCAEHATCPVLVVHGETPPPPAAASPEGH